MPSWGIDEWRTAWAAALLTAGTAGVTAMVVLTLTRTIFRILLILPGLEPPAAGRAAVKST